MIECREIVDSVKDDIAKDSPLLDMKVVVDKNGEVCRECTELQNEFAKNPGGLPPRRGGLIIASVVGGVGLAITSICVPFVVPALRRVCLPFVPATTVQVCGAIQAI